MTPTPSSNSPLNETLERVLPAPVLWLYQEIDWIRRACRGAFDRFYWDNGFSRAASLAYSTLLSLIPFTAVIFGWIASFGISQESVDAAKRFLLRQFIPDASVVDEIFNLLHKFDPTGAVAGSEGPSVLFVAALVVTAIMLINSIEYTLNEVWQVHESRSISQRLSIFCAIILLVPCLVLSGYYFAQAQLAPLILDVGGQAFLAVIQQNLVSVLIDSFAFICLYYLVPKTAVRFRSAVFGGVVAAVLFGLAKIAFARYINSPGYNSYEQIYQTLKVIPIFLVWLYFVWCVIIFGAECAFQAQHLPKKGQVWKRTGLTSGDAALLLAVQSIVEIAQAYSNAQRPPSDSDLAEKLGCSTLVLKPTLMTLERAGILSRGDSRDMPWTLMRAPNKILISDICKVLFVNRREVLRAGLLSELFGSIEAKSNETSIQDLIEKSAGK